MKMQTVKVVSATDTQLDWLVAVCEKLNPGYEYTLHGAVVMVGLDPYQPSTNPAQMHPIIEREKIGYTYHDEWEVPNWGAWVNRGDDRAEVMGETALIAAARCYVMSKLGYEAEVPEELA